MARPKTDRSLLHGRVRRPWSLSDRLLPRRVLRRLQSFLETEVAGGVLLLAATVVALAWANSPWRGAYEDLWHTTLTVRMGPWVVGEDLPQWVNDGLMALFFLVVGLEIKREVLTGELRDPRAAALPAIAALGGMVVPALVYLAFNAGGEGARGWGIPMATDIAFALGVLTIAARHAPAGLKSFLLALAIVDDIGAIIVIAVFYPGGVNWGPLGIAALLMAAMVGLRRISVRATAVYIFLGAALWLAVLEAGVHAAIAGALLGLLTPAVPFQRPRAVSEEAHRVANETVDEPSPPDADAPQWLYLTGLAREAVSPLARVEAVLHPWTSFVVVPVFALANAGVRLTAEAIRDAASSRITLGIVAGLVVGKMAGVTVASLISVRTGIAQLPEGVGWRHVLGVAAVAGIGFTVSLLVGELAFIEPARIDAARIGVLAASAVAGLLGLALLALAGRRPLGTGRPGE